MRYVRLSTIGEGGLPTDRARQYMSAARDAAGTPGEMQITQPKADGTYFLVFANHAHATRFIEIARPRGVRLEPLTQLPDGVTIRTRPRRQAAQGGDEVLIVVLDGTIEVLEALFGDSRRRRPGGGR